MGWLDDPKLAEMLLPMGAGAGAGAGGLEVFHGC